MNTNTLSYVPGPAIGHDARYERMDAGEAEEARDAARAEEAIEARLFALESARWSAAQPAMDVAMQRLAGNPDLSRWLFALWQQRVKWGGDETPGKKALRAYAGQQVAALVTNALAESVQ